METAALGNTEIRKERVLEIEKNVAWYAAAGSCAVQRRLEELEREWDVDRALAAWASGVSILGLLLATRDRRFLVVPALVAAFLAERVLQGWSPQVAVLRKLGFRTRQEIDAERFALKAVRGDFDQLPHPAVPPTQPELGQIMETWQR